MPHHSCLFITSMISLLVPRMARTIAIFVKYTNIKHKPINIVVHSNTLTIVADAQLFEKYRLCDIHSSWHTFMTWHYSQPTSTYVQC